jgi:hypothetical protein
MQPSEKPKFLEVLAGVHDFYGKELSSFAATVWWQAVSGFEFEQATKAISAHLMDPDKGQFMPKPADLVRQLHGTQADRSLIAWGKVLDAIQRVGAWRSVILDDSAIHAAISDMGGWQAVCRSEVDALPFLQKRFTDLHRAYSARPNSAYPPSLTGDFEQRNAVHGHESQPPMLIGDPERAKQVAHGGTASGKTQITAGDSIALVRLQ